MTSHLAQLQPAHLYGRETLTGVNTWKQNTSPAVFFFATACYEEQDMPLFVFFYIHMGEHQLYFYRASQDDVVKAKLGERQKQFNRQDGEVSVNGKSHTYEYRQG